VPAGSVIASRLDLAHLCSGARRVPKGVECEVRMYIGDSFDASGAKLFKV